MSKDYDEVVKHLEQFVSLGKGNTKLVRAIVCCIKGKPCDPLLSQGAASFIATIGDELVMDNSALESLTALGAASDAVLSVTSKFIEDVPIDEFIARMENQNE